MEKVERPMMEPLGDVQLKEAKAGAINWIQQLQMKSEDIFIKKGISLAIIGFLLGRALILSQLAPFGLPFFAAVFLMRRDRAPLALFGLIAGGLTVHYSNSLVIFASAFLLLLFHKIKKPAVEGQFKTMSMYVFASLFLVNLAEQYLVFRTIQLYDLMMIGVEAGLAMILTLIFIQSIPMLTVRTKSQSLKTEEIVSIIILLASVMTGTIGWMIYDLSLDHIFSRYLVLLFGLAGGAAIGSTVGVVTGLIFSLASIASLYQMSLLAFSGLLGGLLKEGRKIGVASGLLIATLLIGLYGEGTNNIMVTLYESLIAVALFILTPSSIINKIAKHIPGTVENSDEQQQYARKVRDVTAQRVEQFSHVFEALSNSFSQVDERGRLEEDEKEFDYFLSNVTEKTCQLCFKKEQCWSKNFNTTYDGMQEIMLQLSENNGQLPQKTSKEWGKYCSRGPQVIGAISQELTYFEANQKLKRQVKESRKLVADQLRGVSAVMDDFAKEIQRERKNHHVHEESILEAIQDFGLHIGHVEIYSLEQGNVDIEMSVPYCQGRGECEKLIAPMLSDILGETIVVHSEECATYPSGQCEVIFRSAKKFTVETGVAHAAKGGGLVSGDSFTTMEIGCGKFAIAISDGMGNGERAHFESTETLKLLQKFLQSGIEEKIAIKSVNSVLSLRTTDEIFSTLDLAMIDLQDARAKFLKICSIPSFIKRGDRIIKIESSNLPMGIIQDFDVDVVSEELKAGDILIMMSDGVFDGPSHVENIEFWLKRKIKEMETDDPQEISDLILEEVIRTKGIIDDDMTVVTSKIKHNTPKWASIPVSPKRKKAQ
ncbi:stage II sporulation protein E [Peribacillus frigoritolerans]|jgi:stage II sporulation protein E|uniref:Stage II sporulation protein E n=1 Tax=Peribacillus frigoritolerans TaxID=450367 RepID=A0AAJ1QIJ5_9BACI|nr:MULTISPECIES: stage II sporulation protein E [Bacillaceae]KOR81317.1 stage II sporulation protein E [Bacillus sp. FJAT-21352]KOR84998.1 stage II sporulation protein E [Bacillus sp. FJAT-22058]MCD1163445.1 stage II sporulation protein E [Peribacillus castrilensis]PAW26537.1 stage II sporulation protein E [Peribacillus simplex]QNK49737.1 stage II sporulation protein E [Brevibacterium sp. PAMC23299]